MTTTAAPTEITLQATSWEQETRYPVTFATEDQALAFVTARRATHYFAELDERPVPESCQRLLELLYPTCPHGMDEASCHGPQHWYYDEMEQSAGMVNVSVW